METDKKKLQRAKLSYSASVYNIIYYCKLRLFNYLSLYLSFSFCSQVYDVQNYDVHGVRIIRIAISKARDERLPDYVQQCEGPGNLLGEDALPYVPEGQREWPDGSLYLYLIGKKPFMPT